MTDLVKEKEDVFLRIENWKEHCYPLASVSSIFLTETMDILSAVVELNIQILECHTKLAEFENYMKCMDNKNRIEKLEETVDDLLRRVEKGA